MYSKTNRLFNTVLDAYAAHKSELLDQKQMFYFLRGVLWAWCHANWKRQGWSSVEGFVMEMEATFIEDIRGLSLQQR